MGVFLEKKIEDAHIVVWEITESRDVLEKILINAGCHPSHILNGITDNKYALHRLSSRVALLFCGINPLFVKHDHRGRPVVDAIPHFDISIAHSGIFSAVMVKNSSMAGIDIQYLTHKLEKVKNRFLTGEEVWGHGDGSEIEWLLMAWCVKEAAFKAVPHLKIPFYREVKILRMDGSKETPSFLVKAGRKTIYASGFWIRDRGDNTPYFCAYVSQA